MVKQQDSNDDLKSTLSEIHSLENTCTFSNKTDKLLLSEDWL